MRDIMTSIEGEYRRYRSLGERTMDQLSADQLLARPSEASNSVATLAWHISGNLESRFTDFLTTDGEKPWRQREDEFAVRDATPEEIRAKWDRGWNVLMETLAAMNDDDLSRVVKIRGVELTVSDALLRSVAHTASHVGQMTYQGKVLAGGAWAWLSIAPGGTAEYNQDPSLEKA